ncbi:MAG: hypothetical protein WC489_00295 [Patescibacteria group bacterium]
MQNNQVKGSGSLYILFVLFIIILIFGAFIVNKKNSAEREKAPFTSAPVENKSNVETIKSTTQSVTDVQKNEATSVNLNDIDAKLSDLDNMEKEVDTSFNDTAIDVMAE